MAQKEIKRTTPSLGEYLRSVKQEKQLENLEKQLPKGFILKTRKGQYEYAPQKKAGIKTKVQLAPLSPQERIFRPKGWGKQKPSLI